MGCKCEKKAGEISVHGGTTASRSLPVRICVALLTSYKRFFSPLLPPSCRFTPTCSEYAIEAVQKRGFVRGLFLAMYRLLRCHPFAQGGYDPVD